MGRKSGGGLTLSHGAWYWRAVFADGRRRAVRLAAATREQAEEEAARLYGFLPRSRRGTYAEQMRALVRLGEWAASELARLDEAAAVPRGQSPEAVWEAFAARSRASAATRDMYARSWRHLASWAASRGIECVERIGPREAEAWAASGPPARAAKYVSTVLRGAGLDAAVFAALSAREEAPAAEQYRRLTADEARAVLAALRASAGPWAATAADMVVVGWYTGLRVADVGRLDASQLDCDARLLRVVPAKTARRKPHPLSIPLVGLAWEVVSRRAEAGGALFPGVLVGRRRGDPPTQVRGEIFAEFSAAFGKLAQPAGWRTSFHSLRASFVSQMDEAGVPASITDAITGHAPQTMHGHYSQPGVAALREAVERAIAPLKI